jgi:hypothetical protein
MSKMDYKKIWHFVVLFAVAASFCGCDSGGGSDSNQADIDKYQKKLPPSSSELPPIPQQYPDGGTGKGPKKGP